MRYVSAHAMENIELSFRDFDSARLNIVFSLISDAVNTLRTMYEEARRQRQ